MSTRSVGARYEEIAADYLRSQGYHILEKNCRCRSGEVDLVAREGEYLCFVEVKFRSSGFSGRAAEAVGRHKQKSICRVVQWYLMRHGIGDLTPCRFDVVAIDGSKIALIRNAFEFIG